MGRAGCREPRGRGLSAPRRRRRCRPRGAGAGSGPDARLRPRRRAGQRRRKHQRVARRARVADVRRRGRAAQELPRYALYRLLEQRRKLPKGLRNIVKQRAPALRDRVHDLKEFVAIDFRRTRAFAYGNFGNVAINVRGREYGTVEPGEVRPALRGHRAAALELVHPETGERLITAVHRRDELFNGPQLEDPGPHLRVRGLRLGRQGQSHEADADHLGHDQDGRIRQRGLCGHASARGHRRVHGAVGRPTGDRHREHPGHRADDPAPARETVPPTSTGACSRR